MDRVLLEYESVWATPPPPPPPPPAGAEATHVEPFQVSTSPDDEPCTVRLSANKAVPWNVSAYMSLNLFVDEPKSNWLSTVGAVDASILRYFASDSAFEYTSRFVLASTTLPMSDKLLVACKKPVVLIVHSMLSVSLASVNVRPAPTEMLLNSNSLLAVCICQCLYQD